MTFIEINKEDEDSINLFKHLIKEGERKIDKIADEVDWQINSEKLKRLEADSYEIRDKINYCQSRVKILIIKALS